MDLSEKSRSRNWYYGWNIVALNLLCQATTVGIIFFSFALLVSPLSKELGVPRSEVVFIFFLMQATSSLLAPLAGKIIDRFPAQRLACSGLLILALSLTGLSMAGHFWQIVLLYCACLSIGSLLAGPLLAQSQVARWFIARRGLAMGFSALGTSIGGFIFPLLMGLLIPEIGWRQTIFFHAIYILTIIPLAWLVLRREPDAQTLAVEQHETQASQQVSEEILWGPRTLLVSGPFWLLAGSVFPLIFTFVGIQVNLAVFAEDAGYSSLQGGTLLSTLFLTMIFGKIFFGFLIDRLDYRLLFWFATGGFSIAILCLQIPGNYYWLLSITVLIGFSGGGILPTIGTATSRLYGVASFGTVMGLITLFMQLGSASGPWLVSRGQEWLGNYNDAFVLLLIVLLPSAIFTYFLPDQPPARK